MSDDEPTTDELTLFPEPTRKPRPVPKMATSSADKPRYTRYRAAERRLCDDCVHLVHEMGVAVAPFPNVAVWRRSAGGLLIFLCSEHRQARADSEFHR